MNETKQNKMATMKISKLVWSMSIPAMFSMLVMSLYNVVDSMFVSVLSEGALTAVSLVFPVQSLIIAFGAGTAVGINSLMSRQLGQGNADHAKKTAAHGIVLSFITGVVFAIGGVACSKFFIGLFTKDASIILMGTQYMVVVSVFSVFKIMQQCACRVMQSTGNMVDPMVCQLIGAITNIILDPIMIFGLFGFPKLEVLGAALATIIGQGLGLVYILIKVFSKKFELQVSLKGFAMEWGTVKQIYAVGLPSIIMQSIGSFMTAGLNSILAGFSDTAVAVMGAYSKLQSFVFMPIFGLGQGALPIMAFNYGAKNKARLSKTFRVYLQISIGIVLVGTMIFWLVPGLLMDLFNASGEMRQIGVFALRVLSLNFIPAAVGIAISSTFQAMGRGVVSMVMSICRQIGILLPLAFLLSQVGLWAVWFALPVAEVIVAVAAIPVMRKALKAAYQSFAESEPPTKQQTNL